MRIGLFASVAVAGFVIGLAEPSRSADESVIDAIALSTFCGSEAETSGGGAAAPVIPKFLPGFGNGGFAITTARPEAQRWFSYGMQLAQAFAHEPAKAAFAEAARLDPDCAMCVWGQAMAAGPTINYGIDADERKDAGVLAARAQALAAKTSATDREKALMAAMVSRYRPSGGDAAYANAMLKLSALWPDDDAVQVLTAEALMDTGKASRVRVADGILATVLGRNPTHVGAIHFYIHSSEWIGDAGKAEKFADSLGDLAPGASHLIHMPSHTWYRVGRYKDAARANLSAIAVDTAWMKTVGGFETGWKVPYYGHNVAFALGGAMMAGDAGAALTIADLYGGMPLDLMQKQTWWQSSAGAGWSARGRYGDPDTVLALAGPGDSMPFVRAMWHYGRGEALARKGDARGVRAEAAAMILTPTEMKPYRGRYSSAPDQLEIARQVLLGRAAMLEGRYQEAAMAYGKAAARQQKAFGDGGDPPIWWYPTRRSVAAALLAAGKPDKALAEANAVLAKWPRDPMSLLVVSRAEAALGRKGEADKALAAAQAGWAGGALDRVALTGI